VSLKTDAHYRAVASDALKKAGIAEPPIPVEQLAQGYGIPMRQVSFPSFFSGAIVYEDGLPVIMINGAKDEAVRRKTLAHLLGHVLILIDDPSSGFPRNSNPDHREAEIVAQELLTPEFMIRDEAARWFNDYRYLARLFGVPEAEMMRRMLDMGIIKQRGVLWDY